jgi:hypothetical protein
MQGQGVMAGAPLALFLPQELTSRHLNFMLLSDLIAKFDFLGIYIQNYGIFTPSNIEYGEFFLLITI